MSSGKAIGLAFGVVTAVFVAASILMYVIARRRLEHHPTDTGGNPLHFDNPMYTETVLHGGDSGETLDVSAMTGKLSVYSERY